MNQYRGTSLFAFLVASFSLLSVNGQQLNFQTPCHSRLSPNVTDYRIDYFNDLSKSNEHVRFSPPFTLSLERIASVRRADSSSTLCSTACVTGLSVGIGLSLLFVFLIICKLRDQQDPKAADSEPDLESTKGQPSYYTNGDNLEPGNDETPPWLHIESRQGPIGWWTQSATPVIPSRTASPWQYRPTTPAPEDAQTDPGTPWDADQGAATLPSPQPAPQASSLGGAAQPEEAPERVEMVERAVKASMDAARAEEARARAERRHDDAAMWGTRLANLQVRLRRLRRRRRRW